MSETSQCKRLFPYLSEFGWFVSRKRRDVKKFIWGVSLTRRGERLLWPFGTHGPGIVCFYPRRRAESTRLIPARSLVTPTSVQVEASSKGSTAGRLPCPNSRTNNPEGWSCFAD